MLLTNSLWSFTEVGRFLPICHMQTFGRGLRLLCVPWVLRRFVSTKFLRIGVLRMQLTDLICGECTTTMQRTVQPSWPINSAHRSFGNFGSTWQYHVHGVTASAELSRQVASLLAPVAQQQVLAPRSSEQVEHPLEARETRRFELLYDDAA
jgi:hypothetical protein